MTGSVHESEFSRRAFLKGGGALIVGFSVAGAGLLARRASAAAPSSALPIPVDQVDSYLTVNADNTVTLYNSVMERGQGSMTGLLQIAAEELDVGMHQISHARIDTATTPNSGSAAGSTGISIGGTYVRAAAATARQALLAMASTQLGVPAASLTVSDGVASGGGRSVTYGQLVGGKLFNLTIPQKVQSGDTSGFGPSSFALRPGMQPGEPGTKPVSQYKLVGKPVPRVDTPDIVTGKMVYSGDVRVPGMLHGRVVRPRGQSALKRLVLNTVATNYTLELAAGGGQTVLSVDERSIKHIDGAQVVHGPGNFVGVVAPQEYDAIRAAAELKVTWAEPASPLPGNGNLAGTLKETAGTTSNYLTSEDGNLFVGLLQQPQTALLQTWMGDVKSGLAQAAKTVSASYKTSYLAHGPVGPHNAVADVTPTGATIIHQASYVGPYGVAAEIAPLLGLPADSVREIAYQGSSFYGGASTDRDATAAAALMSKAVGKPVRVQFMRWDEHGWDCYEVAEVIDLRGGVDAHGKLVAFDYVSYVQKADTMPATNFLTGGIYSIPNRKVVRRVAPTLLAVAIIRSPGDRGSAFATEQMIDELAYAAKIDPLEFRRQNMQGNTRWLEVLDAVAKASNWQPRVAASTLSDANVVTGRGFGFGTHVYNGGLQGLPGLDFTTLEPTTPAAAVAEIEVNKKTGKITVKHIYAACAPGLVVNPARVADQVMGAAIQGTSQALYEEIKFDKTNVTSLDWATYPVLRFKDHPNVTPIVLQHLDETPRGAGEEPLTTAFGAIANAFFDATGVRVRQTPMTPPVVRDVLARAGVK